MKIYSNTNVFDAALERIRYLFNEFPVMIASVSGGKDSTIILELALRVAKELNRLPLRVLWIDQEGEWQGTVDHVTEIMTRPDVTPMWFQMPMAITNNATSFASYNHCWRLDDKDKWIHPKHPLAITRNIYGTIRFKDLFPAIIAKHFPGVRVACITGMRAEESPARFVTLTGSVKYKWVTWGRRLKKTEEHYTFHPIYDWVLADVWKAILDNGWKYNRVYDEMYRHGVATRRMRVSNLHHETAIQDLMLVQEIEPETWNRIASRIPGANTIKHMKRDAFTCPAELPFMFKSWEEYAEHIIESIPQDPRHRDSMKKHLVRFLHVFIHEPIKTDAVRVIINAVLSSDWEATKINNFERNPDVSGYRKWRRGILHHARLDSHYIPEEAKPAIRESLKGVPYGEEVFNPTFATLRSTRRGAQGA